MNLKTVFISIVGRGAGRIELAQRCAIATRYCSINPRCEGSSAARADISPSLPGQAPIGTSVGSGVA
jgi:hypothetical protein